jgi:hypothetical protein
MAEVETPIVTEETALATQRVTGSMLERWLEGTPEAALQKLETLAKVLEQMRKVAMMQTYPSDWVINTSTDRMTGEVIKQVGYLQDSGAERAGKIFGIEVGKVTERREEFPQDKTFAYHMEATAWSKVTGEQIEHAVGSRWSGDDFFTKGLDEDETVNPMDVRKAAYANLHGRAVRALAGLSAVPIDVLRAAGLETSRCLFVGYQPGAKGGESAGATLGSADVKVAFGRSAGKTPAELEDKDLAWYLKAYEENVADQKKEKYKKANQRVLDALKAEHEKRAQARDHGEAREAPAAAAAPAGETGGAAGPKTREEKIGALWPKLQKAVGEGKQAMPLFKTLCKDVFGVERQAPSVLTTPEVDKLLEVPDDILATMAKAIAAPEEKK